MRKLRWGILSTGRIAKRLAKTLQTSSSGELAAVASRDLEKARAFAGEFNVPRAHGSYDALLADPEVDAVYVATPHPQHAEWVIRAARAKKHILCEKPAALTYAQAEAMITAVRENGVFFLEAFMYRCHPQTARLLELIKSGDIGEIRLIECSFGFDAGYNAESRLFANALGGGGILDVGCYCVSMARLIAGAAVGQDFAEPTSIKALGKLDPREGTDLIAIAIFQFPGGILAQLRTSVGLNMPNEVRILGAKGSITVTQPWFAGNPGAKLIVDRYGAAREEISVETTDDLYSYQVDLVAQYHAQGQAPSPAMTLADTLGNMQALDGWRREIGLAYRAEQAKAMTHPLWGGPLQRRADARVVTGTLPGMKKPMTKLVMGGMSARTAAGQIVLDDYWERGGNAFDTAFVYGEADRALGHWFKSRGVREEAVIVAKGAHTPHCNPEGLTRQLGQSLEGLQTDYTDLYIMHRDNPDIPVGEFIDVLNRHLKEGRLHAFGCSNWTIERLVEANAYAEKNGLTGFCILNNQMSLARMIDPVWAGCLSASDPESRAWLAQHRFPLIAWSSQARGFFTGRAAEGKSDDAELVRCWYAEDNFKRKARAADVAQRKGVEEINIALAYVLAQPFPVWTLIGPATTGEAASCFRALDVSLTPEELRWLNLED